MTKEEYDPFGLRAERRRKLESKIENLNKSAPKGSKFEIWDEHILEVTETEIIVRLDL